MKPRAISDKPSDIVEAFDNEGFKSIHFPVQNSD